jgi:hypothetical protein
MPKRGASATARPEYTQQEAAIVLDLLIAACSRLSHRLGTSLVTPNDGPVALRSYAGDRREEPGVVEDAPSRQGIWPSM